MRQGKDKKRWMDGWAMTGCHSVRMMMPDLQGDAAGISLARLSLFLFRGESEEGMPWETFPIPSLDPNAMCKGNS